MRIGFYAPLKAPDHPVPSGDRQMARMLIAALRAGGHEVGIASTFRSFLSSPDPRLMRDIEAGAAREVARLIEAWPGAADTRPDLWFTYHPYYKAPDLIGPALAAHSALPYVTAEASHAGKRAAGPWATWHARHAVAMRAAVRTICFTARDAGGLGSLVLPESIVILPPFLAAGPFGLVKRDPRRQDRVHLVTVAMMRPGDKLRSYAFLAEALAALPAALPWHLTIVGDGPERTNVERLFASLPASRLAWAGERDGAQVAALLADADLYVWPGFGEAYGVAFLEAQATGLPVLAMDCGGIASVVEHDTTGILVAEGDATAYTASLVRLVSDPVLRKRLGDAGRRMVLGERTIERAAATLTAALQNAGAQR